jgi:multimeric flavodoxin WrbA
MNSKVLVINGATRSNGNTDILVKRIQEGGAATGLDIDLVILGEKKIENCIGRYQCLEKAICSIQDDMEEIRTLIEKAKILVLASPMYWCGVTGLMKTFIDRLFYYYHPDTKGRMLGKRAMIITPMNQSNVVYESEILVQFYSRLLNCLGIRLIDMFFFGGIMRQADLKNKPQYLKAAYEIGRNFEMLLQNHEDQLQATKINIVN